MSYIDTFAHDIVGYLAGYPLYRPRAEVKAVAGTGNFSCSFDNLVLGGGSGEHPALVIHKLDRLAAHFLWDEHGLELEGAYPFLPESFFEFVGWGIEHYAIFDARVRSPTLAVPYDLAEHGTIERWLALTIGELVWRCFPDEAQATASELVRLKADRSALIAQPPAFPNVVILPPTYERSGRPTGLGHQADRPSPAFWTSK